MPPKLVCSSAKQPKLPLHVANALLCYSELQGLMEFELYFHLGFKGCETDMIVLPVCLSAFLLPVTSGLTGRFQPSLGRADDAANTVKFLQIQ